MSRARKVVSLSNDGQRMMCAVGTQASIARMCRVSFQAVGKWQRGESKPTYAAREAMARPAPLGLGIPMQAWDQIDSASRPDSRPGVDSARMDVLERDLYELLDKSTDLGSLNLTPAQKRARLALFRRMAAVALELAEIAQRTEAQDEAERAGPAREIER